MDDNYWPPGRLSLNEWVDKKVNTVDLEFSEGREFPFSDMEQQILKVESEKLLVEKPYLKICIDLGHKSIM